ARGLVTHVTLKHNRSYLNKIGFFLAHLSSDDIHTTVESLHNSYDRGWVGMALHPARDSLATGQPRGGNGNSLDMTSCGDFMTDNVNTSGMNPNLQGAMHV